MIKLNKLPYFRLIFTHLVLMGCAILLMVVYTKNIKTSPTSFNVGVLLVSTLGLGVVLTNMFYFIIHLLYVSVVLKGED